MLKIQLEARITQSEKDKTFLVTDADMEFEEVAGIDRGLHYAINDFIRDFNSAGYIDRDGSRITIDESNIIKPKRPFAVEHIHYQPSVARK